MTKKTCRECVNYIQHYAFLEGRFHTVFCGHCLMKNGRKIKPYTHVCDEFVPGKPREEQFVTKKYLTKALLQRLWELELWPEDQME